MEGHYRSAISLAMFAPLLAAGLWAQARGVQLTPGTKLDPIQIGQRKITLAPADAVAFLFVYTLADEESQCVEKFYGGPGRLCTLQELIAGLKTSSGVIGLSRDPAQDVNYRYEVTLIGQDCLILAIPRRAGLAEFAFIGNPQFSGDYYYVPPGADLRQGEKIDGRGYSGPGFKR